MHSLYRAYILCRLCRVFHVQRVKRPSFLFPILIIPVLDMESPQRDPRPTTLPTTIQAGPDSTHDELAYHLPILHMDAIPISPRISLYAPSYPIPASPIRSGPDIAHGCPSRNALSGRTWHHIRPDYATQSRTVLHHRDTDRITPSMPDYDPQSENQKDSKMSPPLYTQLPHFAMFVRKFYFCPYFTH